ncbi:MAG: glutamine amidotransferase [Marinobacter sp.]
MASLLILKTGSTYPGIRQQFGDFDQWFEKRLAPHEVTICDVTAEPPPGMPTDWQGILVTGSPSMVTDREHWSERAAAWLAEAVRAQVPVLGVCYGHQMLAQALGGEVGFREQGRESGTFDVRLTTRGESDPLLGQLSAVFPAHLTHAQSVLRLPPGACLLAESDGDPHQAFRIGHHAWGVQFHPEFGEQIMTAYLAIQAPRLEAEGQDPQQLQAAVRPTSEATSLLIRFADYVRNLGNG